MRMGVVVALLALLSGCASEKMALAPPAGIDFSGHWLLNEADSDDPMRLLQGQLDPSKVTTGAGSPGGQRQGGRGHGAAGGLPGGTPGPTMPAIGALGEGFRWPAREVDIKQTGGVVTMSSGGIEQVYHPRTGRHKPLHPGRDDGDSPPGRTQDRRSDRRGGKPAVCGWTTKPWSSNPVIPMRITRLSKSASTFRRTGSA